MADARNMSNKRRCSSTVHEETLPTPFPLLPFEIVSTIMFHTLSGWDSWDGDESYSSSDIAHMRMQEAQDVLRASQVCRYWRSVALQLPKLWTTLINIDFNSAAWIKELLRRTATLPLDIESDATFDTSPAFSIRGYRAEKWGLVFKELHRIRVLHLLVPEWEGRSLDTLFEALLRPAPLLESLKITTNAECFMRGVLRRPDRLFSANAPRLQDVLLQGMGIPRRSFVPKFKLRSLCIAPIIGEPSLSPSEWLDILEEQPQLAEVYIEDKDGFTPSHLGQGAQHRQVVLPKLDFFFIAGPQGFINEIYPRIVAPRNGCAYVLDLKSRNPASWDQATDGVLQGLANLFETLKEDLENGQPCLAWKICYMDSHLTIDAFSSELTDDDPMLSISMDLSEAQADATIIAIFNLLHTTGLLTEADTLKLRFTAWFGEDVIRTFVSLLHTCTKVSKLVLMGESTVHKVLTFLAWPSLPPETLSQYFLPNIDLLVYNEDRNEIRFADNLLFGFLQRRFADGRKILRLQLCLRKPEYALSLFSRYPVLKTLDLTLKVTTTEEWDVVPRTPFPGLHH